MNKPLAVTAKMRGFTLTELMIVIVVLGILAAIAYPSYTAFVLRGKRAEGRNMLMEAAARQERFYSDNNSYTSTIGSGGLNISSSSENGYYSLAATTPDTDNQTFTLTATPTFTDAACGNMTLTQTGARTSNDNDLCWGK